MPVTIDAARVEEYVMTLAQYGAAEGTGVRRAVYTPEWMAAQAQIAAWYAAAGLRVRQDAVGSVWGRLDGTEDDGAVIVSGSHIDTQLPGGRYDGALGVVAALVALQSLREQHGPPKRTLEAVSLCEEESSRFPGANYWGSRAVNGLIRPGEWDTLHAFDGGTIATVMRGVGLDPARIPEAARRDISTFIELHIEQGPLLERAGLPVGIVYAITSLRHYELTIVGRTDHAGAMPMDLRRDALAGAAEIISGSIANALAMGRPAVTTAGRIVVVPNQAAIVPGKVTLSIDTRHPDPAADRALVTAHEMLWRDVAARRALEITWRATESHDAVTCDPGLVRLLENAAHSLGIPTTTMHSGAGHDSQNMATRSKVAMIFVQSKDGRSHTPEEFTTIAHATEGIAVLAETLYRLAY